MIYILPLSALTLDTYSLKCISDRYLNIFIFHWREKAEEQKQREYVKQNSCSQVLQCKEIYKLPTFDNRQPSGTGGVLLLKALCNLKIMLHLFVVIPSLVSTRCPTVTSRLCWNFLQWFFTSRHKMPSSDRHKMPCSDLEIMLNLYTVISSLFGTRCSAVTLYTN